MSYVWGISSAFRKNTGMMLKKEEVERFNQVLLESVDYPHQTTQLRELTSNLNDWRKMGIDPDARALKERMKNEN